MVLCAAMRHDPRGCTDRRSLLCLPQGDCKIQGETKHDDDGTYTTSKTSHCSKQVKRGPEGNTIHVRKPSSAILSRATRRFLGRERYKVPQGGCNTQSDTTRHDDGSSTTSSKLCCSKKARRDSEGNYLCTMNESNTSIFISFC